jgi:hypothetical protein
MFSHASAPNGISVPSAPAPQPPRYILSGLTRDSAGTALGNCVVEIFETVSGLLRSSTVSDANGRWSIDVTGGMGLTFQAVCYKAGGTGDVEGCSVNTLVGTPS